MKNMQDDKNMEFYIVTDDYEYSSKLLPNIKIIKGNISEDFFNLLKAKYLILLIQVFHIS